MLIVAVAQINPTVGALQENAALIQQQIKEAIKKRADVIVFPELALCGYPPEDLLLKKHFIDSNIKVLGSIAKKVFGITAIIGFVDTDQKGNIYNAAAVIQEGFIKGVYYKHELPNYGVFDEKRYFTPGTQRGLFTIKGVRIGLTICEDIWVDGAVYQQEALAKAKMIINLSSSPYEQGKVYVREALLKRRVKEIKIPIVYVNAVGGQDELVFDGASMVVNAQGHLIARAKQFDAELMVVNFHEGKGSVAALMNDDQEMYQALVRATHDYVTKNGFSRVLIGLSGGIDSALVASIAVDAIGRENVVGISMPSQYNSKETKADAKILAKNLGIEFKEIPIRDVFKQYMKILAKHFGHYPANNAEENLQARIRGNILMAFSNKFNWLVLTTGNKSEMAVGYCTLYGDMSGGYAVLKDVFKTKVYALSRWRNSVTQDAWIPKSILLRAPSAELKPNQTDEASLGSYEHLDKVLFSYIEQHASPTMMTSGKISNHYVLKTINMVDRNEYKRRQAPPGVKVTSRAFGRDWRLPLTNKYKAG